MEWFWILLVIIAVAVVVLVLLKLSRSRRAAGRNSMGSQTPAFPKPGPGVQTTRSVTQQPAAGTPSIGTPASRPLKDSDIRSRDDDGGANYLSATNPLSPVSPLYAGTYDEPARDHTPNGDRGADNSSDGGANHGSDSGANAGPSGGSDGSANSGSDGSAGSGSDAGATGGGD